MTQLFTGPIWSMSVLLQMGNEGGSAVWVLSTVPQIACIPIEDASDGSEAWLCHLPALHPLSLETVFFF